MRLQASLGIILFAAVACSGRFISESDADACADAIWRAHETIDAAYEEVALAQQAVEDGPPWGGFLWRERWEAIELGVFSAEEHLRDALDEIEAAARACGRPEDG